MLSTAPTNTAATTAATPAIRVSSGPVSQAANSGTTTSSGMSSVLSGSRRSASVTTAVSASAAASPARRSAVHACMPCLEVMPPAATLPVREGLMSRNWTQRHPSSRGSARGARRERERHVRADRAVGGEARERDDLAPAALAGLGQLEDEAPGALVERELGVRVVAPDRIDRPRLGGRQLWAPGCQLLHGPSYRHVTGGCVERFAQTR